MPASRVAVLVVCLTAIAHAQNPTIERALDRLYNFDFKGANTILDQHISASSDDPMGYSFRAAVLLFHELNRLQILESEFFADDKRIIEKKKLAPDPNTRAAFFRSIADAETRAQSKLKSSPNDKDALFVLCVTRGMVTDYASLIEKRQFASLSYARQSNSYAVRLLQIDPAYYDAYLTTGLSEYLVGSLPFFIRWFVRFDQTQGSKTQAVQRLEVVAKSGRYLGPFARILLALIHIREKRPRESESILVGLCRDFPENPLLKKELAKVSAIVKHEASGGGAR